MIKINSVKLTGEMRINGTPTTNGNAAELAYLLSVKRKMSGNYMTENDLNGCWHMNFCNSDELWCAKAECEEMGLKILYDRSSKVFKPEFPVYSDLNLIAEYIEMGLLKNAYFLVSGTLLPNVDDELSGQLKHRCRQLLDKCALSSSCDSDLARQLKTELGL